MKKLIIYLSTILILGVLAVPAFAEVYWQDGQSGYNSVNYTQQGVVGDKIGSRQYYVVPAITPNNYNYYYRNSYNPYGSNPYDNYNNYYRNNRYYRNSYGRSSGTQWGLLNNSIVGTRNSNLQPSRGYYQAPPMWYKPYVYSAPKTARDYAQLNDQNRQNGNNEQLNKDNDRLKSQWEKYQQSGDMRDYPFPLTMKDIERIIKEGEAREKGENK